jgi:hypothetical protein
MLKNNPGFRVREHNDKLKRPANSIGPGMLFFAGTISILNNHEYGMP